MCPPRSHFPVSGRCLRVSASFPSTSDLNPPPLLSSGCLSPRSFTSTLQPHPLAQSECTSREVPSPTALDRIRRPVHPADPPAGTFRPQGFSPSRRLAPPETMQGLFHPRCALGVPSDLGTSHGPFSPTGVTRPSLLFTAFSSPATDTCWRALPSCVRPRSAAAPFRGTT